MVLKPSIRAVETIEAACREEGKSTAGRSDTEAVAQEAADYYEEKQAAGCATREGVSSFPQADSVTQGAASGAYLPISVKENNKGVEALSQVTDVALNNSNLRAAGKNDAQVSRVEAPFGRKLLSRTRSKEGIRVDSGAQKGVEVSGQQAEGGASFQNRAAKVFAALGQGPESSRFESPEWVVASQVARKRTIRDLADSDEDTRGASLKSAKRMRKEEHRHGGSPENDRIESLWRLGAAEEDAEEEEEEGEGFEQIIGTARSEGFLKGELKLGEETTGEAEADEIREMVGKDETLDLEEEEDEYDRVAEGVVGSPIKGLVMMGGGDWAARMARVQAARDFENGVEKHLPVSFEELKCRRRDHRANYREALRRLEEDAEEAAQSEAANPVSDVCTLALGTGSRIGLTGKSFAGRAGLALASVSKGDSRSEPTDRDAGRAVREGAGGKAQLREEASEAGPISEGGSRVGRQSGGDGKGSAGSALEKDFPRLEEEVRERAEGLALGGEDQAEIEGDPAGSRETEAVDVGQNRSNIAQGRAGMEQLHLGDAAGSSGQSGGASSARTAAILKSILKSKSALVEGVDGTSGKEARKVRFAVPEGEGPGDNGRSTVAAAAERSRGFGTARKGQARELLEALGFVGVDPGKEGPSDGSEDRQPERNHASWNLGKMEFINLRLLDLEEEDEEEGDEEGEEDGEDGEGAEAEPGSPGSGAVTAGSVWQNGVVAAKRDSRVPDHVKHPHKYTYYSLESVNEDEEGTNQEALQAALTAAGGAAPRVPSPTAVSQRLANDAARLEMLWGEAATRAEPGQGGASRASGPHSQLAAGGPHGEMEEAADGMRATSPREQGGTAGPATANREAPNEPISFTSRRQARGEGRAGLGLADRRARGKGRGLRVTLGGSGDLRALIDDAQIGVRSPSPKAKSPQWQKRSPRGNRQSEWSKTTGGEGSGEAPTSRSDPGDLASGAGEGRLGAGSEATNGREGEIRVPSTGLAAGLLVDEGGAEGDDPGGKDEGVPGGKLSGKALRRYRAKKFFGEDGASANNADGS